MTDSKKTRPGVATPGQARVETAACGRAAISYTNFTSGNREKQGEIEALLQHGADGAIRSAELARLAGCTSVRQLQERIAEERENGALILSTCVNGGGYFLPADGPTGRQEIERYIATLTARAAHTFAALSSAKAALQTIEGQVSMDV